MSIRLRPQAQYRRPRLVHRVPAHAGARAGLRQREQARHHQGQPLAHEQVGEVPGGLRHREHQAQEGGGGLRWKPVPRRRVHRLGFRHARRGDDPRIHALHHQPVRHRGPRDGHVGQRALRPREPRYLLRVSLVRLK